MHRHAGGASRQQRPFEALFEHVLGHRAVGRPLAAGVTVHLPLIGASEHAVVPLTAAPGEHLYGSDAAVLRALPGADRWLWRDAESGARC